jgi:predicted nucleic acid-binding protein
VIVLDASAAAALLLEQDLFPVIVRELEGHDLAAPELMSVELLSVLRG